jgi:hypothetical protein
MSMELEAHKRSHEDDRDVSRPSSWEEAMMKSM